MLRKILSHFDSYKEYKKKSNVAKNKYIRFWNIVNEIGKIQNNEEDERQLNEKNHISPLTRSIKTILQFFCFIFLSIGGLFICNACFVVFKKLSIEVDSVLSYSDALLTVISLVASVAIAFFQYKTQEVLEEYQKTIKESDDKQHRYEILSERFRSLKSLEGIQGYSVNFSIIEAFVHSEKRKTNKPLLISIGDKATLSEPIFYHPFFALENDEDWSECILCATDGIDFSVSEISPHHICIELNTENERVIDFITYPIKNKFENISIPRLEFEFKAQVVDQSSNNSLCCNNESMKFDYNICFEIEPLPSGYDVTGKFPICVTNVRKNFCSKN